MATEDILKKLTGLELLQDGIWTTPNLQAVDYPESGNESSFRIEDRSYWFAHRNKCILQLLSRFAPSGPIVDIGGGNGYVAAAIQEFGIEVILLEPGLQGATNARERGVRTVICSTLNDVNFPAQSLNAAGLFDVLEHIEDDLKFLNLIHHALEPDGKLYLTVPSYKWLWSAEDYFAEHYRRYTLSGLTKKLLRAGFVMRYGTYIFGIWPVPIFFLRTIPSLLFPRRTDHIELDEKEHSLPEGMPGKILQWCLDQEIQLLKDNKSIPFGASCLVVAQKS
jgi:SAM-dependent methyltransferase